MDTEVAVSQVDYRSVHRDWSDRQSGETRGTLHQRSSSRLFFFFFPCVRPSWAVPAFGESVHSQLGLCPPSISFRLSWVSADSGVSVTPVIKHITDKQVLITR